MQEEGGKRITKRLMKRDRREDGEQNNTDQRHAPSSGQMTREADVSKNDQKRAGKNETETAPKF